MLNGADSVTGIKSLARKQALGFTDADAPTLTGFAAYRANVDAEEMLQDPDTAWLLERPALNLWYAHQTGV